MSKQTAVKWLVNQVEQFHCLLPVDMIQTALAMERDQIIEACEESRDELGITNGKKYYEKTYGKEAGHEE